MTVKANPATPRLMRSRRRSSNPHATIPSAPTPAQKYGPSEFHANIGRFAPVSPAFGKRPYAERQHGQSADPRQRPPRCGIFLARSCAEVGNRDQHQPFGDQPVAYGQSLSAQFPFAYE